MKLQFRLLMLTFAGVWALSNSTCLQAQVSDRNIEEITAESLLRAQRARISFGRLGWTDPVIFSEVIIPWELRLLEQSGWKPLTP
jgi:hypothetical protein